MILLFALCLALLPLPSLQSPTKTRYFATPNGTFVPYSDGSASPDVLEDETSPDFGIPSTSRGVDEQTQSTDAVRSRTTRQLPSKEPVGAADPPTWHTTLAAVEYSSTVTVIESAFVEPEQWSSGNDSSGSPASAAGESSSTGSPETPGRPRSSVVFVTFVYCFFFGVLGVGGACIYRTFFYSSSPENIEPELFGDGGPPTAADRKSSSQSPIYDINPGSAKLTKLKSKKPKPKYHRVDEMVEINSVLS